MISRAQFKKLKQGDVIWWLAGKYWYQRTVLSGPANDSHGGMFLTFPIRRRSWTARAYTVYDYSSLKDKIEPCSEKRGKLASGEERQVLDDIGFNVPKELIRERREHERLERIHEARNGSRRYRGLRCQNGKLPK